MHVSYCDAFKCHCVSINPRRQPLGDIISQIYKSCAVHVEDGVEYFCVQIPNQQPRLIREADLRRLWGLERALTPWQVLRIKIRSLSCHWVAHSEQCVEALTAVDQVQNTTLSMLVRKALRASFVAGAATQRQIEDNK